MFRASSARIQLLVLLEINYYTNTATATVRLYVGQLYIRKTLTVKLLLINFMGLIKIYLWWYWVLNVVYGYICFDFNWLEYVLREIELW